MSADGVLADIRLAWGVLARGGAVRVDADGRTSHAAAWFPALGAVFGVLGYAIAKLAELGGAHSAVAVIGGLGVVATWVALGSLRGLLCVVDSSRGAPADATRPSTPAAFAAIMLAVGEATAIAFILARPHELPLLVVPVIAAFAATAAGWLGTPAGDGNCAARIIGRPMPLDILIGLAPLVVACSLCWVGFGLRGVAISIAGLLAAFTVPHLLAQRVGGVTSDVMSASVLITQVILLAVFAAAV